MKITSNEFFASLVSLAYLGTLVMKDDEDFQNSGEREQLMNHLYMEFFGKLSREMAVKGFRDRHGIDIDLAVVAIQNMLEDAEEEEEEND